MDKTVQKPMSSTLSNKVVNLRPIVYADLDMLIKWKNTEEVYRYLGGGFHPISKDQYGKWLENIVDMTGNARRFIIETIEGVSIGMVGLYSINWLHRTCEIGVFIGEESERGKGYATMACKMIEEYAKNCMNMRKIRLLVVKENEQAVKMWKKLNYLLIGEYSRERFINGHWCDVLIMEKFL